MGLRHFLKKPGGTRMLVGGALVALLILAALLGNRWTRFQPGQMDFDHLLTPPAPAWLTRMTTTVAGRKALAESHSAQPVRNAMDETENQEWLGAVGGEEKKCHSPPKPRLSLSLRR